MSKTLASLLAGAGLTAASIGGYTGIIDWYAERSAGQSIDAVLYGANMHYMLNGDWPASLAVAQSEVVRGQEETAVYDTTITWTHDGYCFTVSVPEPAYTAEPVACQ